MWQRTVVAFALAAFACATPSRVIPPPVENSPRRGGELTLVQLDPPAGSVLTEEALIHVVVDYRVFAMDRAAHYGIMPFFADKAGDGRGFITYATLQEVRELRDGSGRADLRFAVKPAWRDERFARPPSISFHLVMQYPESGIDAIAEIGPFSYQ